MKKLLIAVLVVMLLPVMTNAAYKRTSKLTCVHPATGKQLVYTGQSNLFDFYPEYGYYRVKTANSYTYLPVHLCIYEQSR